VKRYFALLLAGLYLLNGCGSGASAPLAPPTLMLGAASLGFGTVIVGTTSDPQVETLTNTGGSELAVNSVGITGTNATDFDQNSACGSSLGAGASCTLNVTFTPSQLGPRSASITITDDSRGSPQVLSLSGIGGDSGPNATLSPTSLTFGNQVVDTTSATQIITLSNYGTTALNISDITTSTNFGQTNTCNSTLASEASCTVSVTFTPGNTGSFSGTLSVTDSAADSPQIVSLSGTGVAGQCTPAGQQCPPQRPACCPGLMCVAEGNRDKCEPTSGNIPRANSFWDRVKANKLE
jgi:ASPM-SPD-2-Hydin domain-containing protein/centrosomal CEP192-like protein